MYKHCCYAIYLEKVHKNPGFLSFYNVHFLGLICALCEALAVVGVVVFAICVSAVLIPEDFSYVMA